MDGFFGIGIGELILIAIIALIVLGPERLPGAFREVAKFVRQVRNLSSEFTAQFGDEFKALEDLDPRRMLKDAIDSIDEEEEAKAKAQQKSKPAAKPATTSKPTPTKPAATSKPTPSKATTTKPATSKPAAEKSTESTSTTTTHTVETTEKAMADSAAEQITEETSVGKSTAEVDSTVVTTTDSSTNQPTATDRDGTDPDVTDRDGTDPDATDPDVTVERTTANGTTPHGAQPTAVQDDEAPSENQIAPPQLVESGTVHANGHYPTAATTAKTGDTKQSAEIVEQTNREATASEQVAVTENKVERDGERKSVAEVEEKQA